MTNFCYFERKVPHILPVHGEIIESLYGFFDEKLLLKNVTK